jgi:hypothetical protein
MSIYGHFLAGSNGHSKSNAYLSALLSYYVYESETPRPAGAGAGYEYRFRATFTHLGPPTDSFDFVIDTGRTEFVILSNDSLTLVCFRGTDEWRDWAGNLGNLPSLMMVAPPAWGSPKVHKNYYEALNIAYPRIRNEVNMRSGRNTKVFLTGHSRGAALATLCAYRLQQVDKIDISGVYTFAGPRVGNRHFRELYRNAGLWDKTHRWVRNNDIGPKWPDFAPNMLPPDSRYYHVGRLNFIDANGVARLNMADPDAERGLKPSVGDHDMFVYTLLMYSYLANDRRENAGNPTWLVKDDIPNGLPHLSPGMLG